MMLKLLDITKLLPIRMMQTRDSIMSSALHRGVVKDEVQVARHFKLAADQNDASSQKHYDICLATGPGVVKNETEAAEHYEPAADQNHASAQFHYAVCLAQG
jgi:TPR repeat protein